MRPRSGGIHSKSEQQYVELADIAQECRSLFYDEPKSNSPHKRRKYAFALNSSKTDTSIEADDSTKPASSSRPFENFNFDQHTYSFQKDCESLRNMELESDKKIIKTSIAIVTTDSTSAMCSLLSQHFGLDHLPYANDRVIDLVLVRRVDKAQDLTFIDCFWIIDASYSQYFEAIFEVYIKKSVEVLDLRTSEESEDGMDKGSMQWAQIERLLARIQRSRNEICQVE